MLFLFMAYWAELAGLGGKVKLLALEAISVIVGRKIGSRKTFPTFESLGLITQPPCRTGGAGVRTTCEGRIVNSNYYDRMMLKFHSRSSIASRADEVLTSLKEAGVGRRPIVWVGHSMGGLLIKQLLVSGKDVESQNEFASVSCVVVFTASQSEDEALKRIATHSKAVLMLSVPHDGSNVASLNSTVRFFLLPSVEVEELRKGKIAF